MLEQTYDGRRFSIKANDGILLDGMFFPFNKEKVKTVDELALDIIKDGVGYDIEKQQVKSYEKGKSEPAVQRVMDYQYYPTVIIFNPNAEIYQTMAHEHNGFWLQFFLGNQINVMCWNYRNYGRSQGSPDPYTCYHDGEAILKFLIKDLGMKGKISVYGRSIGGTIATHLANTYPEYIDFLFIDRSLGNLNTISDNIIQGKCNRFLLNFFTVNWVINSDENFYEA